MERLPVCGCTVEDVRVTDPQPDQLPVPDSKPGFSARFCAPIWKCEQNENRGDETDKFAGNERTR